MPANRKIKPSEKAAILKQEAATPIFNGGEVRSRSPHVTEFEDLVDILPTLCDEYRQLQDTMAPLEARKKELSAEILALLDAVSATAIRGDGWVAVRYPDGKSEKIVAELLLAAGVTMDQIKAGTREDPRSGYVQIRKLTIGGGNE